MKTWTILCLSVLLSACVASDPVKLPERIEVPVSVPCVDSKDVPERPALRSDGELLSMDRYKRTLAMWEERRVREEYEKKQAAIIEACRR
jgi:hypothetical protein